MHRIPPVLDDALGFNLYRVAQLFRTELMRVLADYGFTPEQWQVMQALWSTDESLTQSDIAHLTVRDRHTVSRMLGRMERDGWITRRTHPDDGRAYVVEATAQALAVRDEVRATLIEHFEGQHGVLACLSPDQTAELMTLLKTLRTHLGDE